MLQCVAVCCSVLQCVAVCCSMFQCVAVCCSVLQYVTVCCNMLQYVAVCCSVLQCVVAVCKTSRVTTLRLHLQITSTYTTSFTMSHITQRHGRFHIEQDVIHNTTLIVLKHKITPSPHDSIHIVTFDNTTLLMSRCTSHHPQ